jgi:UDP-3-O-[3-hydroxymyristoyl] glucosamine N-acyltransferase
MNTAAIAEQLRALADELDPVDAAEEVVTSEVFNFKDGYGPVPAAQHINPDGSIGGWVAATATVEATAYVGPEALVFGKARVYDSAWVYGEAQMYGSAWVYGEAQVSGDAWVYGDARVGGNAWVYEGYHD